MSEHSTTLLKPKALNSVLALANTGGVKCTLLLNHEGSLLAHAGSSNTEAITIAALAITLWKNYQRYGNSALHEDKLKTAMIQSQNANLLVRNLSTALLCICANHDVPLGMLRTFTRTTWCWKLENLFNCLNCTIISFLSNYFPSKMVITDYSLQRLYFSFNDFRRELGFGLSDTQNTSWLDRIKAASVVWPMHDNFSSILSWPSASLSICFSLS